MVNSVLNEHAVLAAERSAHSVIGDNNNNPSLCLLLHRRPATGDRPQAAGGHGAEPDGQGAEPGGQGAEPCGHGRKLIFWCNPT